MNNIEQIYVVKFLTIQLVLPSMNAVDTLLDQYNDLLTPELLDSISIVPLAVTKNSTDYRNAIHNMDCLQKDADHESSVSLNSNPN